MRNLVSHRAPLQPIVGYTLPLKVFYLPRSEAISSIMANLEMAKKYPFATISSIMANLEMAMNIHLQI